ncbi:transposon Ty3-G Gag-Pol polyprotein [Trichonephila clavipes]|nr:transposon Ty3-G Gag-Pol polyprotein [Trichonephila clavipes]
MRKKKAPESLEELPSGLFPPERHIQITTRGWSVVGSSPVATVDEAIPPADVVVRKERCQLRCPPRHSTEVQNYEWGCLRVKRGIIGADFLQKFQLLIDLHNRKLIDEVTNLSTKGEVATIQENNDLSTVNRASKYFNLLKSYPDLTKPNLVNRVVKHGVKHHILTTGQPVYSKARQLAPDKSKLAKQEFQFMLDNDIIRPSKSQWASPLHLVNKKDGTLRPCGDYRRLNAQTIPDRYPIPRTEDFNHILKDKKIFSKIDLVKAY